MRSIPISRGRVLERLYEERKEHGEWKNWLPPDFDDAYAVCIGAGPWTMKRRMEVQKVALRWLFDNMPMEDVGERQLDVNCYPLQWQNNLMENMCLYLHQGGWSMKAFCYALIGLAERGMWADARDLLHFAANHGRTTKVISLFARDCLKIPSFPVDRHVRRILKTSDLPTRESELVTICMDYGLDPCKVSRSFFYASVAKSNPNHNSE